MPKLLKNQRHFDFRDWRRRYYTEIRRRMDEMGSRYLFYRDKGYLEQHCDLNVPPGIMAERLMEAFISKIELGIDILPRTTEPRQHRPTMTVRSLADQYNVSVPTMYSLLMGITYTSPDNGNLGAFTYEEACVIRERYRAAHPHRPKKKKKRGYTEEHKQKLRESIARARTFIGKKKEE